MENVVIIDSDILIDYIKNKEDACQTLFNLEQEYRVATTVMNVYELLYGAKKVINSSMKVKAMQSMIYQMVILDMDFEAAVHASEIMHDLEKRGEFIDKGRFNCYDCAT